MDVIRRPRPSDRSRDPGGPPRPRRDAQAGGLPARHGAADPRQALRTGSTKNCAPRLNGRARRLWRIATAGGTGDIPSESGRRPVVACEPPPGRGPHPGPGVGRLGRLGRLPCSADERQSSAAMVDCGCGLHTRDLESGDSVDVAAKRMQNSGAGGAWMSTKGKLPFEWAAGSRIASRRPGGLQPDRLPRGRTPVSTLRPRLSTWGGAATPRRLG
jgi:hypothetical protein